MNLPTLHTIIPLAASQLSRAASRAGTQPGGSPGAGLAAHLPNHWPAQGDLVSFCQNLGPAVSAALILLGMVYLLFGFNLFKLLVVFNAAAVGMAAGLVIGQKTGASIPLAIVGGVVAGAVTWPLMKWAVAVMGGTLGAMAGATIWHLVDLEPAYAWSGALIGLVGLGLLCFILFRGCVMMYTSLQGSGMLIFGLLSLLLKYQDLAPRIGSYLVSKPFLLPMCVFIPAVIGMMYQQAYAGMPKPAGGGSMPPKK